MTLQLANTHRLAASIMDTKSVRVNQFHFLAFYILKSLNHKYNRMTEMDSYNTPLLRTMCRVVHTSLYLNELNLNKYEMKFSNFYIPDPKP